MYAVTLYIQNPSLYTDNSNSADLLLHVYNTIYMTDNIYKRL